MTLRTGFGAASSADQVAGAVDLTGKHALVTGGASGVGVATARILASHGADVTLATADRAGGERVAAELRTSTGNRLVRAGALDLLDRGSVEDFVDSWGSPLDILVNNAVAVATPEVQRTADGGESQFAANVLGHFQLTVGLFEHLAAAAQGARVVSVSSPVHLFCPVVFDDIDFRYRAYDPIAARAQSATGAALLAVAISWQWASVSILANAVTPDAATIMLAAVSPLLDGIGGRYFEDCTEATSIDHRSADRRGVAPYALDPDNAERLWAHATQRR